MIGDLPSWAWRTRHLLPSQKEALWWQPGQASPATYNWLSAPSILTSPPHNHHGHTDKGLLAKIPLISTFKTCMLLE